MSMEMQKRGFEKS